jgi:nanoRNase/pAp phosphatase (c-di-AMP/oligoRNAs hydrolase)
MILQQILDHVRDEDYIFVQTHNYPDHDSVASAYGLHELLKRKGVASHIIYEGEMQRESLRQMVDRLGIVIEPASAHYMDEGHMIVIVDGCKGNKNVTDLIGDEIAVIDHHEVTSPDDVPHSDIRPGYGACSSIIYDYFQEAGEDIPRNVATALMIGINMDTALLTRGVSQEDIQAYASLYDLSDIRLQNSLLRNYIQTRDLDFYRYAIENVEIIDTAAFCYFPEGCNQNLLGILGDFFLALEEVDFVILCAKNGEHINFSLRSEDDNWNSAAIIQAALDGIGFGGGHFDMAGGVIKDLSKFDVDDIKKRFLDELRDRNRNFECSS